jgi:hypothetical protein
MCFIVSFFFWGDARAIGTKKATKQKGREGGIAYEMQ